VRPGLFECASVPATMPTNSASNQFDLHRTLPRAGTPCPLGGGAVFYGCPGLCWRAAARAWVRGTGGGVPRRVCAKPIPMGRATSSLPPRHTLDASLNSYGMHAI